jgi:transposase
MVSSLLLSLPDELVVDQVRVLYDCVTVCVRSVTSSAICPLCSQPATRIHSLYRRTLADVPCGGRQLVLSLVVRKFFCQTSHCLRRIFAERFPELTRPWARMTERFCAQLEEIGFATTGENGARLATHQGLPTSPATMLRRLKAASEPVSKKVTKVGIDDFAFRRGLRYGSILVDLETHQVIDLLPDRSPATATAWFKAHPDIEVISRDRSADYALAATQGAPQALQVADRWHLVSNLADTLDAILRRQAPFQKSARKTAESKGQKNKPATPDLRLTPAQQERREQVRESFARVQSLYEQGYSLREIANVVHIDTKTLRYFVQSQPWAAVQPHRGRNAGDASLTPYLPYLHKRWRAGCQNGPQLWRELRARGYTGSVSSVKPYVAFLRQVPDDLLEPVFSRQKRPSSEKGLSVRRIVWLALSRPEKLTRQQAQEVARASFLHPEVARALTLAQGFVKMLRERNVEALPVWLAQAQASSIREFHQFAQGLERDRRAIEAALSRPESNGVVEGAPPRRW